MPAAASACGEETVPSSFRRNVPMPRCAWPTSILLTERRQVGPGVVEARRRAPVSVPGESRPQFIPDQTQLGVRLCGAPCTSRRVRPTRGAVTRASTSRRGARGSSRTLLRLVIFLWRCGLLLLRPPVRRLLDNNDGRRHGRGVGGRFHLNFSMSSACRLLGPFEILLKHGTNCATNHLYPTLL